MEQNRITIDTHALIWSVDEALNHKLSPLAKQTIIEAEKGGVIYVPTIVLLEVLRLVEKGRFPLLFDDLLVALERSDHHRIIPFDTTVLRVAMTAKGLELHDRLIVATTILTDSVLVSKDRAIRASGITVVW